VKNCIVEYFLDDRLCWWDGIGWVENRKKAKKFSLPEVEMLIEKMRGDQVFSSWRRFDEKRTAL
jgi:hypothetical protein